MISKKIITLAIAAALIICCLSGTASARYTSSGVDNSGIDIGDTVYRGETNLDFSKFSDGTDKVDYLQHITDGDIVTLTNQKGSVISTVTEGTYGAYNNSVGRIGSTVCRIAELNLGTISVSPYPQNSGITDTHPSKIPKSAPIIFYLTGSNLHPDKLSGIWNGFTLINDNSETRDSVVNLIGNTQSLNGIANPTLNTESEYAFRFIDQNGFVSSSDSNAIKIKFTASLNGLTKSVSYSFEVVQSGFSITGAKIECGNTGSVMLTGIPFTEYTVYLTEDGADTPYFVSGENIAIIDDHTIIAVPDWSGTVKIPIKVPGDAQDGDYPITSSYDGITVSNTITVPKNTLTLVFDPAPSDAVNGLFAEGDGIKLSGTVKGASSNMPVYLYITGQNLPENGASLETKEAVVDGDASTFTKFTYSILLNLWEGMWNTGGFEPGTYTIHATLIPYGYTESSQPGGSVFGSSISHDYVISDQSISIKSDESTSGYFAQGDEIKYTFSARGSPGTNGGSRGTVRWYIIGTNFKYSDIKKNYQLLEVPEDLGKIAPQGISTIGYNRQFSYSLDPGTYYLIIQHPGPNMVFDAVPDIDTGAFSSITTSGGTSSGIGNLQSKNAAYALTEMISGADSDDLYVITEMIIEKPDIKITQLENTAVGDSLKISGTTNFYNDDTLSLKINKLDLTNPDNNIAMMVSTERIHPKKTEPYAKYMERAFNFEEIDTSTWFPGTYEARVTNIDTGFESAMTFIVGTESSKITESSSQAEYDKSISSPAKTPTPINTAEYIAATPKVPAPTSTKSSGFGFVSILTAVTALLIHLRRR